jgi:hypothetical protein
MCSNETYSKVHIGKPLSDKFPIQNGLKQGDALSPLLFNLALGYVTRKVQENQVSVFTRMSPSNIAKLKRHKSPGSDEIPAELIQAEGEILRSKIHKRINSIWNKEELPNQ